MLSVTARPPFNSGAFREKITLQTNLKNAKTIDVDVRGRVPQRLEVYPTVLSVRPTGKDAGRAIPRVVRLNNYGQEPVSLLEATVDDPQVKVDVVEQRPGKAYMVRVEFPNGYMPPSSGRMGRTATGRGRSMSLSATRVGPITGVRWPN